jgi:hypothetical protein
MLLPRGMLPLQEVLLRQVLLCLGTSSFFVVLRVYAVFARVALVFSGLFLLSQPPSARGRQSGPREEAVVISFLFQLSPEQGPEPGAERRLESCGCSLPRSLFRPMVFLFHLMLFRVHPAPLYVEQVIVQRPNLVFDRSKSLQKR